MTANEGPWQVMSWAWVTNLAKSTFTDLSEQTTIGESEEIITGQVEKMYGFPHHGMMDSDR